MNKNLEMNERDKESISKFIHLFLQMLMRGFDEMEMQNRLELVKTFGDTIEFYFLKTCSRLDSLENRLSLIERSSKKK